MIKKSGMEKLKSALLIAAIFLFFVIFFFKIHPIMIFDTDDWVNSCFQRSALFWWGAWHPTKVLPEILMPLTSLFGAFGIDLLLHDHFVSISLAYALVVSLFITSVFGLLYSLLKKTKSNTVLLGYYLLCHFWIYRTSENNNLHILYSGNATCYFNYVIPGLINCIVVLWLMHLQVSHGDLQKGFLACTPAQQGAFVLLTYLSIFSNIWGSITLAVYVGAVSLFDGIREIREKRFSLPGYLKAHLFECGILLLWAVQQIFEINGGQANHTDPGPFFPNVLSALYRCVVIYRSFNPYFRASAILILLLGILLAIVYKERDTLRKLAMLFTTLLVIGLYMVLSCARVCVGYIARPDAQYGCFFFGMMILLLCAETILRHLPPVRALVPLMLVIVLCNTNTGVRTFREANMGGFPPDACMRFCRDVEQQFMDAQEMGSDRLSLVVPRFDSVDNWPIARYATYYFSDYFYKMGLTEKQIEVTQLDPQDQKNIDLRIW